MQRTLMTFVIALAVATPIAHAHAETPTTVRVPVSTAGLDLHTQAGGDALLRRLERAADRACGGRPSAVPLAASAMAGFDKCRDQALNRAMADLGSRLLARRMDTGDERARLLASR